MDVHAALTSDLRSPSSLIPSATCNTIPCASLRIHPCWMTDPCGLFFRFRSYHAPWWASNTLNPGREALVCFFVRMEVLEGLDCLFVCEYGDVSSM
jgi:hypothetical protein